MNDPSHDERIAHRRRRRARRHRRRIIAAAAILAAAGVVGGWSLGPGRGRLTANARALYFISKIRRGEASDSDYILLGRTRAWFAQDVLEEGGAGEDRWVAEKAMLALYEGYPESETAQACREFEDIRAGSACARGHSEWSWRRGYFNIHERRSALPPVPLDDAAEAARWESFLVRFPHFAGADDASYHLGAALLRAGRFADAARAFARGTGAGDGDVESSLQGWLFRALDHGCSPEELEALGGDPFLAGERGLLDYTRGLVLARLGRFVEALDALDAVQDEVDAGTLRIGRRALSCNADYATVNACDASPTWWPAALARFGSDLRAQRELLARVAEHHAAAARAREAGETREAARAELAVARALLSDRHALLNLLVHECSDPIRYAGDDANDELHAALVERLDRSRGDLVALAITERLLASPEGSERTDARPEGSEREPSAPPSDLGPRLRPEVLEVRAAALWRIADEWHAGHRSHWLARDARAWRRLAVEAGREGAPRRCRVPSSAVASAFGGFGSAGIAAPRPVGPAAMGAAIAGAIAARRDHGATLPPRPERLRTAGLALGALAGAGAPRTSPPAGLAPSPGPIFFSDPAVSTVSDAAAQEDR